MRSQRKTSVNLYEDEPVEELSWPPEFHFKAEKIDFKSGIVEPQELWSSDTYNRSRIDYYGGEVKKYYYWETDDEPGYVVNVNHVSTEDYHNVLTCQRWSMKSELHKPLPEPEEFEYTGEQELEGRWVQVWQHNVVYKEHFWKERTLYTYIDDGFHIPVQQVRKLFFTKKASLSTHVITNYYSYNSTVEEEDLDVKLIEDCDDASVILGDDFRTDVNHLHPSKDSDVDLAFHSYVKHHSKKYSSEHEHEMRKNIFQQNWEMVAHHNRQNLGYKLELNHFADLTEDELSSFTGLRRQGPAVGTHPFPHSDEEVAELADELPENYDMRVEGYISAIKNQAQCGSCWAFSSTAAVEGALARSNGGRILDLSEQALVDCAWGFGNRGCHGGDMQMAFMYLTKHGISLDEEYGPYLEQDGLCHMDNMTTVFSVRGYSVVTKRNPEALRVALYKYGPTAVSIHFSRKMAFYASGIFYDPIW
ncbi:hypothetical protein MSG28_003001 [Choristoneura fumiferana]|uniref:Uncharacterized protein n=1 Tax=Choristoneura fumiferana TaxID=7141 RepID=A0ACC0JKD3_CHOFU|nr:hypothetical protein MSG28_003001 [Choristoneura fumiferana]